MKTKWFSLGCLTSVIILIAMGALLTHSIIKMSKFDKVEKAPNNMFLKIDLTGMVEEFSPITDNYFDMINTNAFDIIKKIKKAKNDPNVRGILLEPQAVMIGLATLNEITLAINDFKTSGKPVYAFLNVCSDRAYMLATCADKIYLTPSSTAGIVLTGVGGQQIYWKDTFSKIGVDYEVFHAGQYKGAGENLSRNNMSEPVRKSMNDLYDTVYDNILTFIAKNRNITYTDIKNIYEKRENLMINQEDAITYKLVDELKYKDDLYKEIEKDPIKLFSISKYKANKENNNLKQIAVVYANGTISSVKTSSINKVNLNAKYLNPILDKLIKDDKIKAVVLRVNSPGGSALESDIMWNKIKELKKVKPVVVSMSDVAASGGYFISAPGDKIFADPFTITGSIGVVGMIPNASELGKKIGIHTDGVTKGKYRDFISMWEPMSVESKQAIRKNLAITYKEFKSRVKEGRNMDEATLEPIAQGRVWTSKDALKNKLVDEIGTLDDAVKCAADLAKVTKYGVNYYPKQKSLIDYYLKNISNIPGFISSYNNVLPKEIKDAVEFNKEIKESPIQMRAPILNNGKF